MVTRINGFSGMDIDLLVKNMMATKRASYDKLSQTKQQVEWKRDNYREINSKLYTFRYSKLTDTFGKDAALNGYKAVQTGYKDALQVDASSTANGIDMKVKINQLATNTEMKIGTGETDPNKQNGHKTFTTLAEVAGVKLENLTEDERKEYLDKGYDLTINGVSFKDKEGKPLFNGLTSISTMISTINANDKANVQASYDELTGELIFKSKTSGEKGKVEISTTSGAPSIIDVFGGQTTKTDGVDAKVNINGKDITESSNNFTINGINFRLLTTTPPGEVVNVTTQGDADAALETIKSFVEEYNSLLSTLNNKVGENKYRDFLPLTDEQKSEMKEDDIKKWTEKAQSGLLKNDDILTSTISRMREIITTNLTDLSGFGITTGKYTEGGKLILDEEKFKNAVLNNPQQVRDVFQGPKNNPSAGIFGKLADEATRSINLISDRAGTDRFSASLTGTYKPESTMGRELKSYSDRLYVMLRNLNATENRYYKQFTAMEQAISKLNSQSSSLLANLGMNS